MSYRGENYILEKINNLKKEYNDEKSKILVNQSLKNYNSFKLDYNAKYIIEARNYMFLISLVKFLRTNNIKYHLIGNGTNILFKKDYDRIIIVNKIDDINFLDDSVVVSSGYNMSKLGFEIASHNFSGFEKLTTIPGTIGGAIYMNARCYGQEISNLVTKVEYLDSNFDIKTLEIDDKNINDIFSYRHSIFKTKDYENSIILSCTLKFKEKKESQEIKDEIFEIFEKRKLSQPLEYPNAGSFFKRVENIIVSKVIDEQGLKGYRIGDAMISEKHAGFIVNVGNATYDDIIAVSDHVKQILKNNCDIEIENEVIEIG